MTIINFIWSLLIGFGTNLSRGLQKYSSIAFGFFISSFFNIPLLFLDKERKAIMRGWAKRELQIKGVLESTVGMYGDLQGIAGKAIQEIEALSFPLIETEGEEGQTPH